jgi:hypothetical protein
LNLDAVKTIDGTKNPFILPNQTEYNSRIWNGLGTAMNYELRLSHE